MSAAETEIEMVTGYVHDGARLIADQRALITGLAASSNQVQEAEELLRKLEDVQQLHEAHLARLKNSNQVES